MAVANPNPWAAQIYWPLRPYELLINHLALGVPPSKYIVPTWLEKPDPPYELYHSRLLLIDEPRQVHPLKLHDPPQTLDDNATFNDFHAYGRARFGSDEMANANDLVSFALSYPQHASDSELLASKWVRAIADFTKKISPGQGGAAWQEELIPNNSPADRQSFYKFIDPYLLQKQGNTPDGHAIRHLQLLGCLKPQVGDGSMKIKDVEHWLGAASLFLDGIVDFIVYFPLRSPNPGNGDEVRERFLSDICASLTSPVFREREIFLAKWIGKLRDRVELDDQPIAQTTLAAVADVIGCLMSWPRLYADTLAQDLRNVQMEDVEGVLHLIRESLNTNSPLADELRKIELISFVRQALRAILQVRAARARGKMRGSMSVPVTRDLFEAAEGGCNRLMILSPPGGGKGCAAEDFHFFRMRRLLSEWGDSAEDLASCEWFKAISETIAQVAYFPVPPDDGIDQTWRLWFLRQVVGTQWWRWGQSSKTDHWHNLFCWQSISEPVKSGDKYKECDTRKCKLCAQLSLKGPSQVPNFRHMLIAGYLGRLCSHLLWIAEKPVPEQYKLLKDLNFTQVACGTLFGDGGPLLSSLDRLFGSASDNRPGLFQTCSYLGGTLFLDEIADAPVAIQDNLLTALQEKKVSRRGWETIVESVGNVVIVSATHKDLRREQAKYRQSIASGKPIGFRPDLMTRLAQYPPIQVRAMTEYFVYDTGGRGAAEVRRLHLNDFMEVVDPNATNDPDTLAFWTRVYNDVDRWIEDRAHNQRFTDLDTLSSRRRLAERLSSRLFKALSDLRNTQAPGPKRMKLESDIFRKHLPNMLDYLLDSE